MKVQINAATRLRASYADKEKAKEYLSSILGHTRLKYNGAMHGLVLFGLDRHDALDDVKTLTRHFGAPKKTDEDYTEWEVSPGRLIQIRGNGRYPVIALVDKKAQFDR